MLPVVSRHALTVLVFLVPPVALVAPLATAPALGLLMVLVLAPWVWRTRSAPLKALARDPLAWLILLFAAWGGATLLWSPEPTQGVTLLPRVLLVAVAGLLLTRLLRDAPDRQRRTVLTALGLGMAVSALWLVVDMILLRYALSGWLTGHLDDPENVPKRGLTLLAILIWPLLPRFGRARAPWAVLALAAIAALVFVSDAGAAKLALLVGGAVWCVGFLAPRAARWVGGAILAALILAMPFALPSVVSQFDLLAHTSGSSQHRLVIWTFGGERVQEHPLRGWGFNMSRSIPGGDAVDPLTGGEFIPLHPHNAPLQWWLEMGLPGALIGAAVCLLLIVRASRMTAPPERAMALATAAAALTVAFIGYGSWQLWWLSALAFVAGLATAAGSPPPRDGAAPGGPPC